MLIPCDFNARTFWKQRTASEMRPEPPEPRNLSDITWTFQLIPAIPIPLLAEAPIVPATWVPCPKSSRPPATQEPFMHVNPCVLSDGFVQMFACRSGCVKSMPVSMTATTTSLESVCVSHAAGQEIFVMSHCWLQRGSVGIAAAWTTKSGSA